jgi:excinuclease UvrABC nuclease subunit
MNFSVPLRLKLINAKIVGKKSFETFEEEMEEAIKFLKLQDLDRVVNYLEKKID